MAYKKQSSLDDKINLIEKVNKIKSKAKKPFYFNSRISWFYETFICCSRCINQNKLTIFQKTWSILNNNLEITYVLKKNIEFDFLKKLILTNKEYFLFPFQFKYINIGNMSSTMSYLNSLNNRYEEKFENFKDKDLFIKGSINK